MIRTHARPHRARWGIAPLAAVVLLAGCEGSPSTLEEPIPAIVLFIGDGMGHGALEAARLSGRTLAMEGLPLRAEVTTASATDSVTDSGAAATALATGVSTRNRSIGVDVNGVSVETVLEAAEARGWATGLVATSTITHATPAAFAAHVADRSDEYEIAVQMAASGVDVLIGGGRGYFEPAGRPDGADLLSSFRQLGCRVARTPAELSTEDSCLIALLADLALEPAGDRPVTLAQLTRTAIQVLAGDPDGFFLMVEGSQIDWAGHANDGSWLVSELEDFDDAVAVAMELLAGWSGAIIVVTADHETGGLTPSLGPGGEVVYDWRTTQHTGPPVPLFGRGDDLAQLPDTMPNWRLGQFLLDQVRR